MKASWDISRRLFLKGLSTAAIGVGVAPSGLLVRAAEGAALAANPAYSRRARFAMEGGLERTMPVVVLWLVLIAAVIVLAAVTLRLARRGDPSDGESKPVV